MCAMLERLSGPMLIALTFLVVALASGSASAQATAPAPSQGMTACNFEAASRDASEQGLALHEAPDAAAKVLAYVQRIDDKDQGFVGGPVKVLGAKDGWLLVESEDGKGWVEGRSVTTHLYRETLKAAANNAAPDVASLIESRDDTYPHQPYDMPVSRIVDCSGPWLQVEIQAPGIKTLSGKPAAPDGTLVGWTDRSCPGSRDDSCHLDPFDYPWSPLPAGIVACDFVAFSNDPDPAGLNVRAEPDRNSAILGRLPPPLTPDGDIWYSGAKVIGYKKGWFLIEQGYTEDVGVPPRPKFAPYTGRGWVAANLLTAQLGSQLKQAPNGDAAEVVHLDDYQSVKARRILSCSGPWAHVEIVPPRGAKLLVKTDAPPGAVRGWVDGTCAQQKTTCDYGGWQWTAPAPLPPE